MQQNIHGWNRALSIAGGAALLAVSMRTHRGRTPAAITGVGLIVRGATGYCPVTAAVQRNGRPNTVAGASSRVLTIAESVTVQAAADDLYEFWRDLSHLPQVMPYLERVDRLDEVRSHWVVAGPAGRRLEWDAEIVDSQPGRRIAWRSLKGADVATAGSVEFHPLTRGGTQIDVFMRYDPPAGRLGSALAWALGRSAPGQVREALRSFKARFETGEVPTTGGQPSGRRSLLMKTAKAIA